VRSGSHSEAGHRAEQLTSLMKMGLDVVRVRERLAQGNDRPRIAEVLLDLSNYFFLPILVLCCPASCGGPSTQDYIVRLS
jgi:hypothetical protein